jgi:hypothetical protein
MVRVGRVVIVGRMVRVEKMVRVVLVGRVVRGCADDYWSTTGLVLLPQGGAMRTR